METVENIVERYGVHGTFDGKPVIVLGERARENMPGLDGLSGSYIGDFIRKAGSPVAIQNGSSVTLYSAKSAARIFSTEQFNKEFKRM